MQNELQKISTWFKPNKFLLSISNTKRSLVHSQNKNPEILQHLLLLKFNDTLAERAITSKFLGVALVKSLP